MCFCVLPCVSVCFRGESKSRQPHSKDSPSLAEASLCGEEGCFSAGFAQDMWAHGRLYLWRCQNQNNTLSNCKLRCLKPESSLGAYFVLTCSLSPRLQDHRALVMPSSHLPTQTAALSCQRQTEPGTERPHCMILQDLVKLSSSSMAPRTNVPRRELWALSSQGHQGDKTVG